MSMSSITTPAARATTLSRLADYVELTKPRIAALVLVCVAAGAFVSSWGQFEPLVLIHALVGTSLIAASASGFNHWLERHSDARMTRTASRPLPAGRLSVGEVQHRLRYCRLRLFAAAREWTGRTGRRGDVDYLRSAVYAAEVAHAV
jgi:heme O synthase-like polyprenyltransferase